MSIALIPLVTAAALGQRWADAASIGPEFRHNWASILCSVGMIDLTEHRYSRIRGKQRSISGTKTEIQGTPASWTFIQRERKHVDIFVYPHVRGAQPRVYSDLRIYCN